MDQFYFSVRLDDDRTLCLAPLTERRHECSYEGQNPGHAYVIDLPR
jgi:hypothetical protein